MLILVATRGGRGGHRPGNHGGDGGDDGGGGGGFLLLSSVICHGGSEMGNPRTLNLFGDLSHTGSQRSQPPHRPRCRTAKNHILKSLMNFFAVSKSGNYIAGQITLFSQFVQNNCFTCKCTVFESGNLNML